jgi:hypothetical protein
MSVILFAFGVLIAGAGLITIGFGFPINEFNADKPWIIAGTTALIGGLLLVGLSAAVQQLTRIAETLRVRPVPRPTRPAEAAEPALRAAPVKTPELQPPGTPRIETRQPADAGVDVSASAIERLRSSMARPERKPDMVAEASEVPLSPNGHGAHAEPAPALGISADVPARGGDKVAVQARESRLDFLFRSKPVRAPQPEAFDSFWPADPRSGQRVMVAAAPVPETTAAASLAEPVAPPELRVAPEPAPAVDSRPAEILKSGVVDGMAYTLYADGSIEAQLPNGTVRFGSIAELRAHIDNNS